MSRLLATIAISTLLTVSAAAEEQTLFVAALPQGIPAIQDDSAGSEVTIIETFAGTDRSYAVFDAVDDGTVRQFLADAGIEPIRLMSVDFINSPEVGGGRMAGPEPRPGHQVYVIERPIPGVGGLPLETKQKISKGSIAAIDKIGDSIEWDHSYLTSEGTFCVYRAVDEDTIREHAALAGAPVALITPVTQRVLAVAD